MGGPRGGPPTPIGGPEKDKNTNHQSRENEKTYKKLKSKPPAANGGPSGGPAIPIGGPDFRIKQIKAEHEKSLALLKGFS